MGISPKSPSGVNVRGGRREGGGRGEEGRGGEEERVIVRKGKRGRGDNLREGV